LVAPHGDEVYAAQRGVVYRIDPNKWSGLDVRIESEINGRKIRHIYEHLSGYQPQKGDYIETGQVIGWVGNTGLSSGAHLHFEVHEDIDGIWTPVDPMSVMEQIPAYQILAINNTLTYITEQVATIADNIANYLRRSGTKRSVGN
jgi:murein DD-endopeptidase MepM/ murein hydrolase activator NlpD